MPEPFIKRYAPAGPTTASFHASPAFVRGLRGPIGSGKSVACSIDVVTRAQMQAPDTRNRRRTRWAIIRNTYGELRMTTMKTWHEWVPEDFGRKVNDAPFRHEIKADLPDGTLWDMEVWFIALDREDDVKKLLSLELTGAWVNEAREVPFAIVQALTGRVGRFPPKAEGGPSWRGIMMDTNPPDDQHWWYRKAELERPKGWEFFAQPAGDSPEAENIQNLDEGYYDRLVSANDQDWVNVYVKGNYGFVKHGEPVYPGYVDNLHCAKEPIEPVPELPLLIGGDPGLMPAIVLGQQLSDGRWLLVDELCADGFGIQRFRAAANAWLRQHYGAWLQGGRKITGWIDPAAGSRAAGDRDERATVDILREDSLIDWRSAPLPDNALAPRLESVRLPLSRLIDGKPGILISPKCERLRKGFNGGYHYRQIKTASGLMFQQEPVKNEFSHPHDALQYLMIGGGEYDQVLLRQRRHSGPRQSYAISEDYPDGQFIGNRGRQQYAEAED